MGSDESWARPETESQHDQHDPGSPIHSLRSLQQVAPLPQPLKVLIYKMDLTCQGCQRKSTKEKGTHS